MSLIVFKIVNPRIDKSAELSIKKLKLFFWIFHLTFSLQQRQTVNWKLVSFNSYLVKVIILIKCKFKHVFNYLLVFIFIILTSSFEKKSEFFKEISQFNLKFSVFISFSVPIFFKSFRSNLKMKLLGLK